MGKNYEEELLTFCHIRAVRDALEKSKEKPKKLSLNKPEEMTLDRNWDQLLELYRSQKKFGRELWAQHWRVAPIFEILRDGKLLFSCTTCHQEKEESWTEIAMHVCDRPNGPNAPDFWKNDHYIEGCFSIHCSQCLAIFRQKIFNPKPIGCINCRSTEFFNLKFEPVSIETWDGGPEQEKSRKDYWI